MRSFSVPGPAAFFLVFLAGCGGAAESVRPQVLPLRTLRLYESGVGYFERSGAVSSSSTSLPVPAGQLDDALKTLVVLGPSGGTHVDAIEFPSSVGRAMARALAGLPQDADAPLVYKDLLSSLRGGRVSIHTRQKELRGRVIEVVGDAVVENAPPKPDAFTLLLLGEGGLLERVPGSEIESVKALDPSVAAHLDAALDALAPHGTSDRALQVLAHTTGTLTLGYVAEAPVYRMTYRLVLDDAAASGTLQGWALVHNDTEERWRGVHVDLANGRPDSFLVPLAAPRYDRRTLVAPERALSTVPQLLDTTPDRIWGDNVDGAGSGLGGGEGSGTGSASGFGSGHGRLGGSSERAERVGASDALRVGNLADVSNAAGAESGALFVYSLAEAVDLDAHSSALLPFLQRKVDVQEITWLADFDASPRTGARLVNDTTQTVPAGPISFFAHGGFAGEATLERMKPGMRAFIDYGTELDVIVTRENVATKEAPQHLAVSGDQFVEHFLKTTAWTYAAENRSGRAKSLYASLPIVTNATVTGADKLDFDTKDDKPVAVFALPAGKKIERKVTVVEGLSRTTRISALHAAAMTKLASSLTGAEAAAASDIARSLQDLEAAKAKVTLVEKDIATVDEDLKRWRETLKAAGGDHGASAALVQRVVALEDRLIVLRKQHDALTADTGTKSAAVHAAVQRLHTQ